MKKKLNSHKLTYLVILGAFVFFVMNACNKVKYTQTTTDDVNITGYLEKNPEQFSLWSQILERSGTMGYLAAYGKYTVFTPNNAAVKEWLASKSKTSVDQMTPAELKDVVRFHVLPDTIATTKFTDGKLPQITLYGQYLQTGVAFKGGVSSYVVNKTTTILLSNVRTGNGIIHVIDHVLVPASKTLAATIEGNARYSIFTEALKATGFYDSLNYAQANIPDTTRRFQTVVLESDSALRAAGFTDFAALKAKLSKTGDPRSHTDSLWMYVAYHISTSASYTPDIISSPSLATLVPSEIVTTKLVGTKILLNEDEFNGVVEPGVEINRTFSDLTASNGVLHEAKSFYKIKPRVPTGVFFDIGDQPELKAMAAWRIPGQSIGLIQNGKFITAGIRGDRIPSQPITYSTSTLLYGTDTRSYANRDVISFNASNSNTARNFWIEFRSPMLVKGKYKIWICYTYNVSGPLEQIGVDVGTPQEQLLPNLVDFTQQLSSSGVADANGGLPSTDGLMLTNGFKRYMATTVETATDGVTKGLQPTGANNGWKIMVGKLAGVADIKTTDKHWIRFTCLRGNGNGILNIDMIHFIPIDDDQNYPRFSPSGAIFKRP